MGRYWISDDGAIEGPYEDSVLKFLEGFSQETLVSPDRPDGAEDWKKAGELPDLRFIFDDKAKPKSAPSGFAPRAKKERAAFPMPATAPTPSAPPEGSPIPASASSLASPTSSRSAPGPSKDDPASLWLGSEGGAPALEPPKETAPENFSPPKPKFPKTAPSPAFVPSAAKPEVKPKPALPPAPQSKPSDIVQGKPPAPVVPQTSAPAVKKEIPAPAVEVRASGAFRSRLRALLILAGILLAASGLYWRGKDLVNRVKKLWHKEPAPAVEPAKKPKGQAKPQKPKSPVPEKPKEPPQEQKTKQPEKKTAPKPKPRVTAPAQPKPPAAQPKKHKKVKYLLPGVPAPDVKGE